MKETKDSPVTREMWYMGQKIMLEHIKNMDTRLRLIESNQEIMTEILKKLTEKNGI